MTSNNGWQSMFNSVLIEMSRSSRLGEDSTREVQFDEGIAKTIQGICEKAGITGILRSKKYSQEVMQLQDMLRNLK